MRLLSICVFFALAASNVVAAQVRAGAAKASITPHSQVWLAGARGREQPVESASGDIYARALAIDDGSGGRVVFLSAELLAIPRVLAERVAADIMRAHALERGQIVINATGTRSAPFVQGLHPVASPASTAGQRSVAEYTSQVARVLFDVATAALTNMQPVQLAYSSGSASFAVNAPLRGAVGASSLGGPVDTTVPVLRVTTMSGDVLAVLFGYACRNAALTDGSRAISGDFAGVASAILETRFPGAVALFFRLCDGDQSPAARGAMESATQHGTALAAEVSRLLSVPAQPVSGRVHATLIESSLSFVPHTREQFELESKSGDPRLARRAKLILDAYEVRAEPRRLPYPIQAVRFTKGFAMVALAGEPYIGYAFKIRKLLGLKDLMIAGGSNDAGYLVPGSETDNSGNPDFADSIVDSGFPGAFTGETEQRILDAVERAWKRLGK